MEVKGNKYVVLYFTDWQMRLIHNVLGVDCHFAPVEFSGSKVVKYMVPCPAEHGKTMFLTDWQQREIRDETGECCECIDLGQIPLMKYGVMPK